jgi:hypothetical protein
VFLGRFVAFFRAVMPALAGTAGMAYRRFLAFNAAGGLVWGTGYVLFGYLAGNSYKTAEKTVGRGVAVTVAALLLAALAAWRIRRHPTGLSSTFAAASSPSAVFAVVWAWLVLRRGGGRRRTTCAPNALHRSHLPSASPNPRRRAPSPPVPPFPNPALACKLAGTPTCRRSARPPSPTQTRLGSALPARPGGLVGPSGRSEVVRPCPTGLRRDEAR